MMVDTVPVKVRPGYAVNVNVAFWPALTLPISASLMAALTSAVLRFVSVMNPLLVLVLVELLLEVDEVAFVAPPVIHWPTEPFRLAMLPSIGAVNVAPSRLPWAVVRAACALATTAAAESRSFCVGGASVEPAVAI